MKSVPIGKSLLFLFIMTILTTAAPAADRPPRPLHERATLPARLAAIYALPADRTVLSERAASPEGVEANPPARSTRGYDPVQIAETRYDVQYIGAANRQVEHRAAYLSPPNPYGEYIHFDWTSSLGQFDIGIGYQAYETGACQESFQAGGLRIEMNPAGFTTIDADPGGWAIPAANQDDAGTYFSHTFWDFYNAGPAFGVFTPERPSDGFGWYQNNGTGPENANLWPKVEWDIDGSEQVLHMVAAECGGEPDDPLTISYYRRVGPYGADNGFWSEQRVIDTVMDFSVTVASSPVSDRVAIVWTAPCDYKRDTPQEFDNHFENDVWYALATDNGVDWAGNPTMYGNPSIASITEMGWNQGGNITWYYDGIDFRATADISALFAIDQGDQLNIIWGCRRWQDSTEIYRRQSGIFHWKEDDGISSFGRTVVKALWDTGGMCYTDPWISDVSQISLSECDGKLYTLFTQYGRADNPCGNVDEVRYMLNGYLYVSVFDPVYGAWDRPQRVTNAFEIPTACIPGDEAGPGDCNGEAWGSMARYGRLDACALSPEDNALDIIYIHDYAPGAVMTDLTHACDPLDVGNIYPPMDPVMWVVYPCREAVPEPLYSDDAGAGYGICYEDDPLVVGTSDLVSITLTMENPGLLPNSFNISWEIDENWGNGQTDLTVFPSAGVLEPGGGTAEITVDIYTYGEMDQITVLAHLTVDHEGADSPRIIPMCITVADNYTPPENAIIATVCKRLRLYNTGQLSNDASNASLDFMDWYGDPDECADMYLRDGSPIICRDVGGEIRCFFTVYDNAYASEHALRPVTPLYVDSNSYFDYTYASAEFITGDSTIRMTAEYYAPKDFDSCGFIIQKLRYWNIADVTLSGVAVGEVLDWDIPSNESDVLNGSDFDESRGLIYQSCYNCASYFWPDPCDTFVECNRYGGVASCHLQSFKNYMTLENSIFVYPQGPFGPDAPLPPDTMYGLMTGNDGFLTADIDSCEDLFTLVTFGVYDLQPSDTQCAIKILTTSRDDPGAGNLKWNVDLANAFIDARPDIMCAPDSCDAQMPGDANGDGWVNHGDAMFLLFFLCGTGPAPDPLANGDANGDCVIDSLDQNYILDHVFGGGPPPVSCTCMEPEIGPCPADDICTNSWCDPVFVVCPGGDMLFRVYLRDVYDNPVVGVTDSWIRFFGCNDITPCPNSTQEFTTLYPVAPSDANGMLAFYMDGGECDNACFAEVITTECILDTVPVRALDINGDYVVSISNDFDQSLCNDYNGDGVVNFNDVTIFNAHVPHSCDLDPCDLFGYEFSLQPESNLLPGQTISLELELANNNIHDSCYIGFVGFFYSEYGTGTDPILIENVPFDSTLGPSQEALISIPYTIPPEGHGCLHAKFMTDCCEESIELTRCFQSIMPCKPDSNVCYDIHIQLDSVPVYDTVWHQQVPPGWSVYPMHVPGFPLYAPDSLTYRICTPDLSSLGDSAVVVFCTCFDTECTDFQQFENRVVITSQTGDANGDCMVNVSDAVYLINYVFKNGDAPVPLEAGDPNCDGSVNVGDAVTIINFVFKGGDPPCMADEQVKTNYQR